MNDDLLDLLAYELGEIQIWEAQCPGVLYLSVLPTIDCGGEYYAVTADAPISQDTRTLGRKLECVSAHIYPLGGADSAWLAVEYEVLRYKTKRGLPLPEGKTLRETALYGMELIPNYFGAFPVPGLTPWGRTLRHRPLDNGVYWIETEQCVAGLAVCWPIWETELPDGLAAAGQRLEQEDGQGCLYFPRQTACAVIFELLRTRPALAETGLIRRAELMNAVWNDQPGYALDCNVQEQMGLNDAPGLLLRALGVEDRDLEGSPEYMIAMDPEAGTDYIGFWR